MNYSKPMKITEIMQDRRTLCQHMFGFDIKNYRYLVGRGVLPALKDNSVDLLLAMSMYIAHLRETKEQSDLTEERRLKTRVERQIKEMEEKKMRGELMERAEVDNELIQRTYVIKSDMLAIEKRLIKWSDAREIVKKGHLYMMKRYSAKTGVFRGGK